jgi:hypothetical protein
MTTFGIADPSALQRCHAQSRSRSSLCSSASPPLLGAADEADARHGVAIGLPPCDSGVHDQAVCEYSAHALPKWQDGRMQGAECPHVVDVVH